MTTLMEESTILSSICPDNVILRDDTGTPSVMVRITKKTMRELGLSGSDEPHPAFRMNGRILDEIYISKFENAVAENGAGISLPGYAPACGLTWEDAFQAAQKKGSGWHLLTRAERSLLSVLCRRIGHIPNGNNDFGKDRKEEIYIAAPAGKDADGRTTAVLTGSGPLSWTHDGTAQGIWNLKGNVWEWTGGIRLVRGELQILKDNDAADESNSQARDSECWRAVCGTDGSLLAPDGQGTTPQSLKLSWEDSHWVWRAGSPAEQGLHCSLFRDVDADETAGERARLLLQTLQLLPAGTNACYEESVFWADTSDSETVFDAGGRWNGGTQPSVFTLSAAHPRDFQNDFAGFRTAYIKPAN